MTEHRWVPSLMDGEWVATLDETSLRLHKQKKNTTTTIPLADVASIHLSAAGGRGQALIKGRGGERILLTTHSVRGFARFEQQTPTYKALLAELVEAATRADASPTLTVGSTVHALVAGLSLGLFVLYLAAVLLLLSMGGELQLGSVVPLAMAPLVLRQILPSYQQGLTRSVRFEEVPARFFP